MNRIYVALLFIVLFNIETFAQIQIKSDTTVVVEDCQVKTIIKEGNLTTVHTEILDCFWDSEVDTNIIIKDCVKQIVMSKEGHKRIYETKLACYWDDAIKQVDTFLFPKQEGKWYIKYVTHYKKADGETKSNQFSTNILATEAYRAGLDTIVRREYCHNHLVFKQYSLIKRNRNTPVSVRDTTVKKQKVLERVNQIRANYCQCGDKKMKPASNLKWSDELACVAYLHAKDMFERDYFSHISPEGADPGSRIKKSGFKNIYLGGENIAEGQVDGCKAVESWKKSPGHCENMMNQNHSHVGVARYLNKYVMLLGSER